VIIIGVLSIVSYWISFLIPDVQFSNRFLHAFGGGFLGFLVCFLAVKDNNLKIDRFRFFVFSFLIVIALGVANELMEFILQTYTHFIFSPTSTDTWLDLASNLVGIILAAAIFVPFVSRKRT
jgi:hypothetical protein